MGFTHHHFSNGTFSACLPNQEDDPMADKQQSTSTDAGGQKGVTQEQVGSGKDKDPNNFANNPERASAAGKKGGEHSHDRS
jgi:general stress protein YciG